MSIVSRVRVLFWTLLAIYCVNLVDALSAIIYDGHKINGLMQAVYVSSPIAFLFVKMGVCGIGVTMLWKDKENQLTLYGSIMLLIIYLISIGV